MHVVLNSFKAAECFAPAERDGGLSLLTKPWMELGHEGLMPFLTLLKYLSAIVRDLTGSTIRCDNVTERVAFNASPLRKIIAWRVGYPPLLSIGCRQAGDARSTLWFPVSERRPGELQKVVAFFAVFSEIQANVPE